MRTVHRHSDGLTRTMVILLHSALHIGHIVARHRTDSAWLAYMASHSNPDRCRGALPAMALTHNTARVPVDAGDIQIVST